MKFIYLVIYNDDHYYDKKQINIWITQICYGLSYLHGNQIIHRNIKPSKSDIRWYYNFFSVLLGKYYDDVRLSDFGMARPLEKITRSLVKEFAQSTK